jgi:hypothetical protein
MSEDTRAKFVMRGHVKVFEYVPGFGGHSRRWQCKCVIDDEFVCGRVPVVRESERRKEMRLRGACVIAAREARISAWLAELAGQSKRKQSREAKLEVFMRTSARLVRDITDAEWREALNWVRQQKLTTAQALWKKAIAWQFWIELRRPPVDAKPRDWLEERRQAWVRACEVVRADERGYVSR